jgi:hypothetical protein
LVSPPLLLPPFELPLEDELPDDELLDDPLLLEDDPPDDELRNEEPLEDELPDDDTPDELLALDDERPDELLEEEPLDDELPLLPELLDDEDEDDVPVELVVPVSPPSAPGVEPEQAERKAPAASAQIHQGVEREPGMAYLTRESRVGVSGFKRHAPTTNERPLTRRILRLGLPAAAEAVGRHGAAPARTTSFHRSASARTRSTPDAASQLATPPWISMCGAAPRCRGAAKTSEMPRPAPETSTSNLRASASQPKRSSEPSIARG